MKRNFIVFFCIAIISISLLIGSYRHNIVFLDKNTLYRYLIQDNDNYYKTFTQKDMNVRKVQSVEEYYDYIQESVGDFTNLQKRNITECIYKADLFFSQLKFPYFDNQKLKQICWTFGCIHGNLYEDGLPHTRIDVIVLPAGVTNQATTDLTSLLIHEKVHVYQKLFPEDVQKYYTSKGLQIVGKRNTKDNIRANPDADENIYKNEQGKIMALKYQANPKSITDTLPEDEDHPNEKMSYDIGNLFLR